MKIVVLAGGLSPEREVSLTSGSLIANALMENGHSVLLLDVYKGLPELPADPGVLFRNSGHYEHKISCDVPDLAALKAASGNGDALIGANVLAVCRYADKVFLALHGSMGENGQLQATLDTHGIAYTGSGYLGCALAMDKEISKRLFRDAGIATPEGVCFDFVTGDAASLIREVGFPCVVKPLDCGSSVGVSMADDEKSLRSALGEAARWGTRALVEKRIFGRELTISVLDGQALPAVEIVPRSGFYDYRNKYQGTTDEICPAQIPADVASRLAERSLRAFEVLRLRGYARFDFIWGEDGELYCLEANSLPGMTPTSLLPQAAAAAGISYAALCEKIVSL